VIRVADDLTKPNGVIGSPDGRKLYIADHGAGQTFVYDINEDGTLADKRLFCAQGSDGMTRDEAGNLYLTDSGVSVYDAHGNLIQKIETPMPPANVAFAGPEMKTLFITARTTVYTIKTSVAGQAIPARP
jgi:gluconolactonase